MNAYMPSNVPRRESCERLNGLNSLSEAQKTISKLAEEIKEAKKRLSDEAEEMKNLKADMEQQRLQSDAEVSLL